MFKVTGVIDSAKGSTFVKKVVTFQPETTVREMYVSLRQLMLEGGGVTFRGFIEEDDVLLGTFGFHYGQDNDVIVVRRGDVSEVMRSDKFNYTSVHHHPDGTSEIYELDPKTLLPVVG